MLDEQEDTAAYRIYVTDCLAALCQTNKRYYDIVYDTRPKVTEDSRSGEEITQEIITRLGLKVIEEGGGYDGLV